MAVGGYENVQRETVSGRELEARALTRCALMLGDALTTKNVDITYEAVKMNSRLWLLFYSEIESRRVTLPPEVERNILALANYVVKVSPQAFAGDEKTLETLISINRNIAAGLYSGNDETSDASNPTTPSGLSTSA